MNLSVFDLLGMDGDSSHPPLYTNFHAPTKPTYWCIRYNVCLLERTPLRMGETMHLFFEAKQKEWKLVLWNIDGDQPLILERLDGEIQAKRLTGDSEESYQLDG